MNFWFMLALSLLAGSISTMNIWADSIDHTTLHINDVYMVMLMTSWMGLFTALYNYKHESYLYLKIGLMLLIIILTLVAIRTQLFVTDRQFLKGMIPHHSMAITMSKKIRERTTDQREKKLADDIIRSQESEIGIMRRLLSE